MSPSGGLFWHLHAWRHQHARRQAAGLGRVRAGPVQHRGRDAGVGLRGQFPQRGAAQRAAAHQAVGVFWGSGAGDDVYQVSHSSAMGAATDASVGWFEKSGGCDVASVGQFGMGAQALKSHARYIRRGVSRCIQLR